MYICRLLAPILVMARVMSREPTWAGNSVLLNFAIKQSCRFESSSHHSSAIEISAVSLQVDGCIYIQGVYGLRATIRRAHGPLDGKRSPSLIDIRNTRRTRKCAA